MTRAIIASTIVSLFIVACAPEPDDTLAAGRRGGGNGSDNGDPNATGENGQDPEGSTPGADPTQPGSCAVGTPHVGFASTDFVADRKPGGIGDNRRRVKPFSALRTEFQRTIGVVPASLAQGEAAYGQIPPRWYVEPTAGAVSLYTTYSVAFTACYDSFTAPTYAEMPTAATAEAECAKEQRKAWQRTPTPEETKACVDLVTGLTTETVARRRWAHGCASILTSAGFTTY